MCHNSIHPVQHPSFLQGSGHLQGTAALVCKDMAYLRLSDDWLTDCTDTRIVIRAHAKLKAHTEHRHS